MNSHNTKQAFSFHKTPAVKDSDKQDSEVISTTLVNDSGLAIADDLEGSCDPYNSTGQHVIIKSKLNPED